MTRKRSRLDTGSLRRTQTLIKKAFRNGMVPIYTTLMVNLFGAVHRFSITGTRLTFEL